MFVLQLQAVCALAGFYVGEQYSAPWAATDVPAELQMQIFPRLCPSETAAGHSV